MDADEGSLFFLSLFSPFLFLFFFSSFSSPPSINGGQRNGKYSTVTKKTPSSGI